MEHRERIFDLFVRRGVQAVALSRCAGYRSGHRRLRNHSRHLALSFLDEAVELLRRLFYKGVQEYFGWIMWYLHLLIALNIIIYIYSNSNDQL